jgi:hypothetical protein
MAEQHHDQEGKLDSLMDKAQDALGKFMDDPEKVDKAKTKAEDVLAKRVGQEQATEIVNKAEDILDRLAHRSPDQEPHPQE